MKPSILFAVGNENLLKELISITIPLRDEFDCFFAESGEKAIQLLANNRVDIVFSSTEIVLSSGANLLHEIKRLFPETIRFALVQNLESPAVAKSSQYVHQFVTLPITKDNLKERIDNILQIQKFLRNEKVEELIKNTTTLPSMPEIYIQIEEEVAKKDFSLNKIANLISKDPNLTAKILQIVNSAYFGLRSEITNINYALAYLGVNVIKSLVFYIHLFSNFKVTAENRKHLERFWQHSLFVASNSYHLSELFFKEKRALDISYTAGVLHDVGKFVLLNTLTYPENLIVLSEQKGYTHLEAEEEIYQCTHAEIGAYLLGLWGFPISIVEAVAYHHKPSQLQNSKLNFATVVHIADFIYHAPPLDVPHIFEIGFEKNLLNSILHIRKAREVKRR